MHWSPVAQIASRTFYEAARLRALNQWWHWMLLVGILLAVAAFVMALYRRDGRELPRPTRWGLLLLRLAAFVGVFIFFLQIEKRSEQKLVKDSRSILLIDTSQSMGLADENGATNGASRIERVAGILSGGLVDRLRESHDVVAYGFDQSDRPTELATLPRTQPPNAGQSTQERTAQSQAAKAWVRRMLVIARVALTVAVLAALAHVLLGNFVRNVEGESWALLVAIVCLITAGTFYAVSNLRYPNVGWQQAFSDAPVVDDKTSEADAAAASSEPEPSIKWAEQLAPRGIETRLGDAIQFVVDKERGGPIAGISVFTDGNVNAGVDFRAAVAAAAEASIPVHLVGLGSDKRPTNIRVVDIEAPRRVYPGDVFQVQAFLQAYGLQGSSATIKLTSQTTGDLNITSTPILEDEQIVTLTGDGDVLAVQFEVTPQQLGRRKYTVQVNDTLQDLDDRDNQKSTDVQIVDRKNKVLLLAGGPTREYRFVRTLCHRDKDTTLHVYLQSSGPGAAQESDRVLVEFPATPEELFEYDCIVAFDPDWEALDAGQIELLERWVAEKSGGLILVAGPVHTPEWTTLRRDSRTTKTLKGLYPVTFFSRSVMRLTRGEIAKDVFPVRLTPDGLQSRYLWLDDTAVRSEQTWSGFEGVYAAFPVRGLKPGALLYAQLDKASTREDAPAIFMAEQFYGAGRVFYIGSGELWRLRALSPNLFERIYTQLIRHVSQGRLLRDSSRGVLMVGKDRCVLGETVIVRASLTDAQFRPLTDAEIDADLIQPDGVRLPLKLLSIKDAARAGTFAGQFTAVREGDYRIELVVPQSDELELLTAMVKVRVPELEIESPQRNDAIMNEIAAGTGGVYFTSLDSINQESEPNLPATLIPQDQETYLPGTPDRKFQQRLMSWLMALICGVLSLEWLVRRIHRLA